MTLNDQEKKQYLTDVSQCLYDIIEILDAFFLPPDVIDKQLDCYYVEIKENLENLLNKKYLSELDSQELKLPNGLLSSHRYILDNHISSEMIIACTKDFLGIVQRLRMDDDYKPVTGIKSPELRLYLLKIKKFKKESIRKRKNKEKRAPYLQSQSHVPIPQLTFGPLEYCNDETVRFNGKVVEIRRQLSELLRNFLQSPKVVISYNNLFEDVINDRRGKNKPKTKIQKYVYELNQKLLPFYGKKVIFSHSKDGYIFDPD